MKLSRPDLAAYALAALCVVLVAVLVALGKTIPDLLSFVAVTSLGAGAGASVQNPATASGKTMTPAPAAPAPQPLISEPATGVMRVATHSPS